MLKFSGDYAKMKFDDDEIKRLYSVKNELQSIKTQLYNYAISNDGINSLSVTVSHDQLMGLRNKFLHRSNKEDNWTMTGRYDKSGNPDRDILKG